MLREYDISKTTLKIFYIAYILTSLSGILITQDEVITVFIVQVITMLVTILFLVLLYIIDDFKIYHHISMIFYAVIVTPGMWHGLGSAAILHLMFSITLAQVMILTFKGKVRLIYLLSYVGLNVALITYDYLFRADNPDIQLFTEGRLSGTLILMSGFYFILIINRIFIEDLLRQLKNHSFYDMLTETKNSRAFYEEVKMYDSDYDRYSINYVIVYLDIDNYKEINDTYGHLIGDKTLSKFANIVKANIRPGDELYRIGGDEFILVLQNISIDYAIQKMESIHYKISSTEIMDQKIEFSYGIASKDEVDADVAELMHKADKLMYENKSKKK